MSQEAGAQVSFDSVRCSIDSVWKSQRQPLRAFFLPQIMGLATVLLDLQMSRRLSYDAERNTTFANFEGMAQ
jgi:hypothetical protein